MAQLEFNQDLMVGNQFMDKEHEMLIEYINMLDRAIENEASKRIVGEVLKGVVEYTKTHFFLEEEMMEVFQYPDREAHLKAHKGFKETALKLIEQHESGEKEMSGEVMDFLQDWLKSHILKIDTKLAAFLKGQTIA